MSTTVAPAITIEIRTEQGVEMRAMDRAEALNHGRVLAGECRRTRREYKAAMLALGEFLLAVKAAREWGGFGAWLAECGIHAHTAQRSMREVRRRRDEAAKKEVAGALLNRVAADQDAILAGGSVAGADWNGGVSFASNNANTTTVANYKGFVRFSDVFSAAGVNASGADNAKSEKCGAAAAGDVIPCIDLERAFAAGVEHPCQESSRKTTGAVAEKVVAKIERPAAQLLLDQVYEAQREAREAMAFVTGWLAGPDANRDAASIAAMLREIRTFKERAEKVAAAKAGA